MQDFERSKFFKSYQFTNIISRYFYTYVPPALDRISGKSCVIEVEDVLDLNREDDPTKMLEDKALISIDHFKEVMR